MEAVSFGGRHLFQSKRILLVKVIPFGGNISKSEKIACNEAIPFSGSNSF